MSSGGPVSLVFLGLGLLMIAAVVVALFCWGKK